MSSVLRPVFWRVRLTTVEAETPKLSSLQSAQCRGLSGFPFIPGHEIVGEVVDIGGGTAPAHGLQVGQRVGVGWIKSSCERCAHCLRGEVNICREGPTPINAFGGLGGALAAEQEAPPDGLEARGAAHGRIGIGLSLSQASSQAAYPCA